MKDLISLPFLVASLLLFTSCRSDREKELFNEARNRYEVNQKLRAEIKTKNEKMSELVAERKFLLEGQQNGQSKIIDLQESLQKLNNEINKLKSSLNNGVKGWVEEKHKALRKKLESGQQVSFPGRKDEIKHLWALDYPDSELPNSSASQSSHSSLFYVLKKKWDPGISTLIKQNKGFNEFDYKRIVESLNADRPLLKELIEGLLHNKLKEHSSEMNRRGTEKKLVFLEKNQEQFLKQFFQKIKSSEGPFPSSFSLRNFLGMSFQDETPLTDHFRALSSIQFAKFLVKESLVSSSWYEDYKRVYAYKVTQALKLQ